MTIPEERTRALIQTREFLRELATHSWPDAVPEAIRREAIRLMRHYPGNSELTLASKALPHLFAAPGVDAK